MNFALWKEENVLSEWKPESFVQNCRKIPETLIFLSRRL